MKQNHYFFFIELLKCVTYEEHIVYTLKYYILSHIISCYDEKPTKIKDSINWFSDTVIFFLIRIVFRRLQFCVDKFEDQRIHKYDD